MSVGKLPEGEMPSGERLPEWVNQIRGIFEKIKGNKKIFRKLTKYARDDLEIIEKSREKGSITELPTHQSTQGGRCGVSCPPRADKVVELHTYNKLIISSQGRLARPK